MDEERTNDDLDETAGERGEAPSHAASERPAETDRRQGAERRLDDAIGREPHDVRHDDQTDSGERTYGTPDDPAFSAG